MYAAKTTVSIEKTRMEIEAMLTRFGASKMATFVEASVAVIIFEAKDRRLKFSLPLPVRHNSVSQLEQARRSRWRGLFLCIKAKLESVESGIESFEEAFLAHVLTPDGTVYDQVKPRLAEIAKTGSMVPLLPAPHRGGPEID
jgi:hypothetical protein